MTYAKILSANNVGANGNHQGGICVPKKDTDLLAFFPVLDPKIKNPDAWILCIDERSDPWKMRYVYYNNKLHDEKGTRNEYRITWMTSFFNAWGPEEGDRLVITKRTEPNRYDISIEKEQIITAPALGKVILNGWHKVF